MAKDTRFSNIKHVKRVELGERERFFGCRNGQGARPYSQLQATAMTMQPINTNQYCITTNFPPNIHTRCKLLIHLLFPKSPLLDTCAEYEPKFAGMNRRLSPQPGQPQHRPSFANRALSRRFSAISTAETGVQDDPNAPVQQAITEEIEEIKRYEDFTTIDWVQDAAREQLRRRVRRRESFFERDGVLGWRRKIYELYDAQHHHRVAVRYKVGILYNSLLLE